MVRQSCPDAAVSPHQDNTSPAFLPRLASVPSVPQVARSGTGGEVDNDVLFCPISEGLPISDLIKKELDYKGKIIYPEHGPTPSVRGARALTFLTTCQI